MINLINILKKYIDDKEYAIIITNDYIYIKNYTKLTKLNENTINIEINNKVYIIKGNNFKISKNISKELQINGNVESINTNDKN